MPTLPPSLYKGHARDGSCASSSLAPGTRVAPRGHWRAKCAHETEAKPQSARAGPLQAARPVVLGRRDPPACLRGPLSNVEQ